MKRFELPCGAGDGATLTWTHHQPPVRRSSRLAGVLEQIVAKIFWHNVIVEDFLPAMMFAERRVEDVQRAVVRRSPHVLDVILHLHLHGEAFVVWKGRNWM